MDLIEGRPFRSWLGDCIRFEICDRTKVARSQAGHNEVRCSLRGETLHRRPKAGHREIWSVAVSAQNRFDESLMDSSEQPAFWTRLVSHKGLARMRDIHGFVILPRPHSGHCPSLSEAYDR